jgi:hypothetical protein
MHIAAAFGHKKKVAKESMQVFNKCGAVLLPCLVNSYGGFKGRT